MTTWWRMAVSENGRRPPRPSSWTRCTVCEEPVRVSGPGPKGFVHLEDDTHMLMTPAIAEEWSRIGGTRAGPSFTVT